MISTTAHNIVNSVNNKLKRSLHSKNIHMTSPPAFITEGLEGGGVLNVFIRKFRGVNSLIVPQSLGDIQKTAAARARQSELPITPEIDG